MPYHYNNYETSPEINIPSPQVNAWESYPRIIEQLRSRLPAKGKTVLVLEMYPGVDEAEVLNGLAGLKPAKTISSEEYAVERAAYRELLQENLTEDRVFGRMTLNRLEDYFPAERLAQARAEIAQVEKGLVLVYGVGASLLAEGDLLVYADMARWEIQNRFKKGKPNWHSENSNAPFLEKYKQGYFVEWRLADRQKKKLFPRMDLLLDTNVPGVPKLATGEIVREALRETARRPFRLVPYFDPGVWGGQWMKEVCGLPKDKVNYAWSFDGVPEENSLYFRFATVRVEIPAMDLVFVQPHELLGERVHGRFGDEFPIRFDFLDTMGGQNLSLQVHPLTEYIQNTFGMHYTQDESYYILDCAEQDAHVYLGLKENIDSAQMLRDLRAANTGGQEFDAERYVNKFPVKKHDHVLIPAGTVHCSGSNTMVLEISSTPYIFTFKLWDWSRLGLDGLPRPIHIEHGAKVIQWDRTTSWVEKNLLHQEIVLHQEAGVLEEHTGLHEREFIETRRHRFTKEALHSTQGSVNMLNLVEGEEAEVFSPTDAFRPFTVHYAETFVIPAAVDKYGIRPTEKSRGQELMTIKAYVR